MELAILSCETVLEAKKMGHQITKSKDTTDWKEVAKEICAPGKIPAKHQPHAATIKHQSPDLSRSKS